MREKNATIPASGMVGWLKRADCHLPQPKPCSINHFTSIILMDDSNGQYGTPDGARVTLCGNCYRDFPENQLYGYHILAEPRIVTAPFPEYALIGPDLTQHEQFALFEQFCPDWRGGFTWQKTTSLKPYGCKKPWEAWVTFGVKKEHTAWSKLLQSWLAATIAVDNKVEFRTEKDARNWRAFAKQIVSLAEKNHSLPVHRPPQGCWSHQDLLGIDRVALMLEPAEKLRGIFRNSNKLAGTPFITKEVADAFKEVVEGKIALLIQEKADALTISKEVDALSRLVPYSLTIETRRGAFYIPREDEERVRQCEDYIKSCLLGLKLTRYFEDSVVEQSEAKIAPFVTCLELVTAYPQGITEVELREKIKKNLAQRTPAYNLTDTRLSNYLAMVVIQKWVRTTIVNSVRTFYPVD